MSAGPNAAPQQELGINDEDMERANLYALLSQLFYAPPSVEFLKNLSGQTAIAQRANQLTPSGLAFAWMELCSAAERHLNANLKTEYQTCFVSVGKPPVFLYISYYASGFLHEKPLAKIRQHLERLGFARREGVSETEDHIAALCEVMRGLILNGNESAGQITQQKEFFQAHMADWFEPLCDAIDACESASFYKAVGGLLREFLTIERVSFDYED